MKKPRNKAYRQKHVHVNAMDWAISGAYTLPKAKQAELLAPVNASLLRLQRATSDRDDWNTLASALNLAEALCGLQIGPNLLPAITKGMEALHEVAMRMLGGRYLSTNEFSGERCAMIGKDDKNERERAKSAQLISATLSEAQSRWPMALELYAHNAKVKRAKYQALLKEGFTEQQALELCWKP